MNEKEALTIMLEMWDYIYLNRCAKWCAILTLSLPNDMDGECSCCEFAPSCDDCPVEWPPQKGREKKFLPCVKSYYVLFKDVQSKEDAMGIRDLALKTLNEKYPE